MMMAGVLISAPFGPTRAPATATAAVGGAIPVAAGRAPRLCHNSGSELDPEDQLNLPRRIVHLGYHRQWLRLRPQPHVSVSRFWLPSSSRRGQSSSPITM